LTAAPPVLQTRAPTGNKFGPMLVSLLSSPITFHVTGSMVIPAKTDGTLQNAKKKIKIIARAESKDEILLR
jgi:hypothetical protein